MQHYSMKSGHSGQVGKEREGRFRFLLSMLKFLMYQRARDFPKVD